MRLLLASLLGFAAALPAQTTQLPTPAFFGFVMTAQAPQFASARYNEPAVGRTDSPPTRTLVSRVSHRRPANLVVAQSMFDSLARRRSGHTRIGTAIGLGLGAGIGYLISIPRVHAIEHRSDGPFQQIEYVVDPAIGAVIGGVVGGVVGSHVR
jgi:hypothetical protein